MCVCVRSSCGRTSKRKKHPLCKSRGVTCTWIYPIGTNRDSLKVSDQMISQNVLPILEKCFCLYINKCPYPYFMLFETEIPIFSNSRFTISAIIYKYLDFVDHVGTEYPIVYIRCLHYLWQGLLLHGQDNIATLQRLHYHIIQNPVPLLLTYFNFDPNMDK